MSSSASYSQPMSGQTPIIVASLFLHALLQLLFLVFLLKSILKIIHTAECRVSFPCSIIHSVFTTFRRTNCVHSFLMIFLSENTPINFRYHLWHNNDPLIIQLPLYLHSFGYLHPLSLAVIVNPGYLKFSTYLSLDIWSFTSSSTHFLSHTSFYFFLYSPATKAVSFAINRWHSYHLSPICAWPFFLTLFNHFPHTVRLLDNRRFISPLFCLRLTVNGNFLLLSPAGNLLFRTPFFSFLEPGINLHSSLSISFTGNLHDSSSKPILLHFICLLNAAAASLLLTLPYLNCGFFLFNIKALNQYIAAFPSEVNFLTSCELCLKLLRFFFCVCEIIQWA